MRLVLSLILTMMWFGIFAQTNGGNVQIIEEPGIKRLMADRYEYLKSKKTIDGYRVQLFFGTRDGALKTREKLTRLHPE